MFMKFFLESINILFTANKISCFYIITMIFPRQKYLKTSLHTRPLHVFFQFSSVAQSCLTLCDSMDCSTPALLSITNFRSLLKLMSIESVMPSNHLILCHPILLPSIFPSIRVFSNELALCIRGQSSGASASVHPMNIQD